MFRQLRRSRWLAALVAVVALVGLVVAAPAGAAYPTSPSQYVYGDQSACAGDCVFYPGDFTLYSSNGRDKLALGLSGNFAGYDSAGRQWFSSDTTDAFPGSPSRMVLKLQDDGNVVVYGRTSAGNLVPYWASGTQGLNYHYFRLTMGGDGHFSLWRWIWTSGSWERVKSFGNGA